MLRSKIDPEKKEMYKSYWKIENRVEDLTLVAGKCFFLRLLTYSLWGCLLKNADGVKRTERSLFILLLGHD
jgi:hypothetical protein